MSKLFISHSSKDKEFVRRLAQDLQDLGHNMWFDEWEIKVGDCIVSKVDEGLSDSDYVVIVLSPNAVESGWVDKEWKTKYWDEITTKEVLVLPILLEDCKMPNLLKTKKYADFRTNYAVGLVSLCSALPTIKTKVKDIPIVPEIKDNSREFATLLSKIHSRQYPLSQCIAEAIPLIKSTEYPDIGDFLRSELSGWDTSQMDRDDYPDYRVVEAFVSPVYQINLNGPWSTEDQVFSSIERDKENFFPWKLFMSESVSTIESKIRNRRANEILTVTTSWSQLMPNSISPDSPATIYARSNSYERIYEAIRNELTKKLLSLI